MCLIFRQGVGEQGKLLTDPSIVSNACPCQTFGFLPKLVICAGDLFKLLFGNHRHTWNSSPATCWTSLRILKIKILFIYPSKIWNWERFERFERFFYLDSFSSRNFTALSQRLVILLRSFGEIRLSRTWFMARKLSCAPGCADAFWWCVSTILIISLTSLNTSLSVLFLYLRYQR